MAPAPALRPDTRHFLASYPPGAADQPIDAYLDLIVGAYGYIAAGLQDSAPYRPIFIVSARLTRARDKTVLMQDAVVYNPLNPNDRVVTIAPMPPKASSISTSSWPIRRRQSPAPTAP